MISHSQEMCPKIAKAEACHHRICEHRCLTATTCYTVSLRCSGVLHREANSAVVWPGRASPDRRRHRI